MANPKENYDFDLDRAIECAFAYSISCGLGCSVSDVNGTILFEAGYGCASCEICSVAGLQKDDCIKVQAYGMSEAERFGGKYIYFCPAGFTCLVSPIIGQHGAIAKITAGPFLMVDRDDFIAFDLKERLNLPPETINKVLELTAQLPCIPPNRVNTLSTLLFMSIGFINNISAENRLLEIQDSDSIQGQISEYIMYLKSEETPQDYPMKTEKALLASIMNSDKPLAQELLNELLGYILFSSGGNFSEIKLRIYELLALISRTAVETGASSSETFQMNHRFYLKVVSSTRIDELCFFLAELINQYIDKLFTFSSLKNADVINKAVHHIRRNFAHKLTLEDVAKVVSLSPTYFSKLFSLETGQSFNKYLNHLRIEKSKRLLIQTNMLLIDVANLSGFEDQSYFTKVFKRVTGISPNKFRKSGGRYESAKK